MTIAPLPGPDILAERAARDAAPGREGAGRRRLRTLALAQDKNPVTSVVKEILPRQQKNLVAAVEGMPSEKFSYKPTEQQMTFGHLVLHMIEANNHLCSKIGDVPEPKAAALKESDGKVTSWNFELGAIPVLLKQGWRKDSLKAGDQVYVEGSLAKDGSKSANARLVKLPDGRRVFAGSSAGDAAPNQ